MKSLSFIAALLLLAVAARAEKLSVGGFEVRWEDGWSLVSKGDPVRYAGPGPTGVTIDLLDHGEMDATEKNAEKEKWCRYAKEELLKLALRHGEVVIPFKEEKLDSGYTLFSVASAKKTRQQRLLQRGVCFCFTRRSARSVRRRRIWRR